MSSIAIDGPAGAGKTTVARAIAEKLGWSYVDTGAMYRAVAVAVLEAGVDPHDPEAVSGVARRSTIEVGPGRVTLDGHDVTDRIRRPDATLSASIISKHPAVRAVLVGLQRRAAAEGDVVMEGRDIGTVVLPDADVKVFLTATLDRRASRRAEEIEGAASPDAIRSEIERRDRSDEERSASPLQRADGAVVIDTTDKTVDQVVGEIVELVLRVREGKA